ncbi:MAG: hypothetical protein ACLVCW_06250 [Campylobacter sp.]
MAESHVISALVAKHAELQGRIKSYQEAIKKARDEISTISKSIKIFDPNYDLRKIAPKKTRERYFKHKELTRLVIEHIKNNDNVDINELTEYVMRVKVLPQKLHKLIYGGIHTVLENLVCQDVIECRIANEAKQYCIKA